MNLTNEDYQKLLQTAQAVIDAYKKLAETIIKIAKTAYKAILEFLNSTVYKNYRTYKRFRNYLSLKPVKLRHYIRQKISINRLIKVLD